MAIKSRLNKLGTALANRTDHKTFDEALEEYGALGAWLDERGFPDHLAAVEAGEIGPAGLQEMLAEYARHDVKQRAWARIETALDAGELPDDSDIRVHCGGG